ncbi:Sensory transduction protein LytR [Eubacterium limosum]|uniref:Stage 0 sporulation protein A homolog n=1 Tax=Eubacterium limosum TaxID=1736 RepID=A0A6N3B8L3_EUBLI
MFRIGVCDDEAYFRQDIEKRLEAYFKKKPFKPEIHIFEKGQELLEEAEKSHFDLVFLDIEMPDVSGVTVGKRLREIKPDIFLIFVTSHHQYVRQAFRLDAFQYFEKPLNDVDFKQEMDRMITESILRKQDYVLEYKGVKTKIPILKIIYLESTGWNVIVHTKDENYKIVGKLGEEEKRLAAYSFIRVHQSYLVNMQYITRFFSDKVFLQGLDEPLPVSRKYKETAKKAHLIYQSGTGI